MAGIRLTDGGWPMTNRSSSPAGALRRFVLRCSSGPSSAQSPIVSTPTLGCAAPPPAWIGVLKACCTSRPRSQGACLCGGSLCRGCPRALDVRDGRSVLCGKGAAARPFEGRGTGGAFCHVSASPCPLSASPGPSMSSRSTKEFALLMVMDHCLCAPSAPSAPFVLL